MNGVVHFGKQSASHEKENLETHVVKSVGGDQSVKNWEIGVMEGGRAIEVRKNGENLTSVADAAGMQYMEGGKVVVVGIGMGV